MKLEYRYYVANRTGDGLIKIVKEEIGPYYNMETLITDNGYDTKEDAIAAMINYNKAYKARYNGWCPHYTAMILEEITVIDDE